MPPSGRLPPPGTDIGYAAAEQRLSKASEKKGVPSTVAPWMVYSPPPRGRARVAYVPTDPGLPGPPNDARAGLRSTTPIQCPDPLSMRRIASI